MTIATGQTITAADLNSLYTNSLTKLRTYNRYDELVNYNNYNFTDIGTGSTTLNAIKQTVEFTPPTDFNLKVINLSVSGATVADTFTMTLTGSTLLEPMILTVTSSTIATDIITNGQGHFTTYSTAASSLNILNTLFAGATYKIYVSNTGLATTNYVNVILGVTNGFRR